MELCITLAAGLICAQLETRANAGDSAAQGYDYVLLRHLDIELQLYPLLKMHVSFPGWTCYVTLH